MCVLIAQDLHDLGCRLRVNSAHLEAFLPITLRYGKCISVDWDIDLTCFEDSYTI